MEWLLGEVKGGMAAGGRGGGMAAGVCLLLWAEKLRKRADKDGREECEMEIRMEGEGKVCERDDGAVSADSHQIVAGEAMFLNG